MGRALVLGGGGVAGVAWELGVLAGLREAGLDLAAADLIVGTSAGAVVGSQVSAGIPPADLYAAQFEDSPEQDVDIDVAALTAMMGEALTGARDARDVRARIGAAALAATTGSEADRRAVIAARLPSHVWPERRLLVTAVDAETGEPVTWDRDSGVGLVDAVGASCAVPGVWPPVTVHGRRYIDGGVRSITNADLARGHERIVVVAPLGVGIDGSLGPDDVAIATLRERSDVAVVAPDAAAREAIGPNPLDPATRPASARAGYAQAAVVLDAVATVWKI